MIVKVPDMDSETLFHKQVMKHNPYFDAKFNLFRCGCGYNGKPLGFKVVPVTQIFSISKHKFRKKSRREQYLSWSISEDYLSRLTGGTK